MNGIGKEDVEGSAFFRYLELFLHNFCPITCYPFGGLSGL